jgi:hypothetical protein
VRQGLEFHFEASLKRGQYTTSEANFPVSRQLGLRGYTDRPSLERRE